MTKENNNKRLKDEKGTKEQQYPLSSLGPRIKYTKTSSGPRIKYTKTTNR